MKRALSTQLDERYELVILERNEKVPYVVTIWDNEKKDYNWNLDIPVNQKGIACTDMMAAQAIFKKSAIIMSQMFAMMKHNKR